jgi:hypothetical protein
MYTRRCRVVGANLRPASLGSKSRRGSRPHSPHPTWSEPGARFPYGGASRSQRAYTSLPCSTVTWSCPLAANACNIRVEPHTGRALPCRRGPGEPPRGLISSTSPGGPPTRDKALGTSRSNQALQALELSQDDPPAKLRKPILSEPIRTTSFSNQDGSLVRQAHRVGATRYVLGSSL